MLMGAVWVWVWVWVCVCVCVCVCGGGWEGRSLEAGWYLGARGGGTGRGYGARGWCRSCVRFEGGRGGREQVGKGTDAVGSGYGGCVGRVT